MPAALMRSWPRKLPPLRRLLLRRFLFPRLLLRKLLLRKLLLRKQMVGEPKRMVGAQKEKRVATQSTTLSPYGARPAANFSAAISNMTTSIEQSPVFTKPSPQPVSVISLQT